VIRLNKLLAQRGVCSRRDADALIAAGSVRIDGRPARVGESVDPDSRRITVRGRPLPAASAELRMMVMNKPRGTITTMRDDRGRPCVGDLLPRAPLYAPVGRLDADSTGVLLLTTDGDLARALTHPTSGVEKRYRVHAQGALTAESRASLGATNAVDNGDGTWTFDMMLREGRNRQVRRMCAQRGLRVLALERTRFGPVSLGALKPGCVRPLTKTEKDAMGRLQRGRPFDPQNEAR
jgi:23S rRNA pseudouridine2605 synthase